MELQGGCGAAPSSCASRPRFCFGLGRLGRGISAGASARAGGGGRGLGDGGGLGLGGGGDFFLGGGGLRLGGGGLGLGGSGLGLGGGGLGLGGGGLGWGGGGGLGWRGGGEGLGGGGEGLGGGGEGLGGGGEGLGGGGGDGRLLNDMVPYCTANVLSRLLRCRMVPTVDTSRHSPWRCAAGRSGGDVGLRSTCGCGSRCAPAGVAAHRRTRQLSAPPALPPHTHTHNC